MKEELKKQSKETDTDFSGLEEDPKKLEQMLRSVLAAYNKQTGVRAVPVEILPSVTPPQPRKMYKTLKGYKAVVLFVNETEPDFYAVGAVLCPRVRGAKKGRVFWYPVTWMKDGKAKEPAGDRCHIVAPWSES